MKRGVIRRMSVYMSLAACSSVIAKGGIACGYSTLRADRRDPLGLRPKSCVRDTFPPPTLKRLLAGRRPAGGRLARSRLGRRGRRNRIVGAELVPADAVVDVDDAEGAVAGDALVLAGAAG